MSREFYQRKVTCVRRIRPTLKTIKRLPRDSFKEKSVFDDVSNLPTAPLEARERILSSLRLYKLEQPLLNDAKSYFDKGRLPEQHRASTQARRQKQGKAQPVYEVRDHTGAGWRGGVIKDDLGDPWLAYADSHNKFHESAPQVFADKDQFWPTSIDLKIRQAEEAELAIQAQDIAWLTQMVTTLAEAVRTAPDIQRSAIDLDNGETFRISFEVDFQTPAEDVTTAHEAPSDVHVSLEIDISDHELRARVIRLYIPFLQPDAELREVVYGADRSTLVVSLVMSQAQLAQSLVTAETGELPRPARVAEPSKQHYFERAKLVRAYVEREALQTLCEVWIAPTTEGEHANHLPICGKCEQIQPAAQLLLDIARKR